MTEATERPWTETISAEGGALLEQVKRLLHEGNIGRIVIKQGADTVAEFPLTVGVAGAVIAPCLAAIGALAALLSDDWSVDIEHIAEVPVETTPDRAAA
jgi:hypothetical protein